MTDDASKKKDETAAEEAKKEAAKAESEKREKGEKLFLENVRAKKRILERPLIESIRRKQKPVSDAPAESDIVPAAEDIPFESPQEKGGIAAAVGGGTHDPGPQQMGDVGGPSPGSAGDGITDDGAGHDSGADAGGDGGKTAGLAFGRKGKVLDIHGNTLDDVVLETFLRRWDDELKAETKSKGDEYDELPHRRWIFEGLDGVMNRRMRDDLKVIEETADTRLADIRRLNRIKLNGQMTYEEKSQLRALEEEEAHRYLLRERFTRRSPLRRQAKMSWLRPIGEDAMGVIPYTMLTGWGALTPSAKRASRWHADNQLLRWQNAIVAQFLPKKASLSWFKEKAKKGIETLFDDWNEEIYSNKKWQEMVKKNQAQLEDIEEELMGYDQFTVAEEKKIQDMFKKQMETAQTAAKEEQFYT